MHSRAEQGAPHAQAARPAILRRINSTLMVSTARRRRFVTTISNGWPSVCERVMKWTRYGRVHLRSYGLLIGHLIFGATVFVTVFTVGWLVSLCFNSLNMIHEFPPQAYNLVRRLENWLFYMDYALGGIALVYSCLKFVIYILEDR